MAALWTTIAGFMKGATYVICILAALSAVLFIIYLIRGSHKDDSI